VSKEYETRLATDWLGSVDEVVRVVPMFHEVSGLLVCHSYVTVREDPREEIINLGRHIHYVTNPTCEHTKAMSDKTATVNGYC